MMLASQHPALDIAGDFVRALKYRRPRCAKCPALKHALLELIQSWGLGASAKKLIKCADVGVAAAELFYPAHPFDLKVLIALYTAVMKWLDNCAEEMFEALAAFQSRFYARMPQLNPALDRFAHSLLGLYRHYETFVADQMISSAISFIAGCVLEVRSDRHRMPTSKHAKLYPYFVRQMSGIAAFYAYACFPRDHHPDVLNYVQAIPDMQIVINFLNDVMSFYKEELDEEQHNYVTTMSRISGKHPHAVLREIAIETVDVHERIQRILGKDSTSAEAWNDFVMGYVAFHTDVGHYRLPADFCASLSNDS